jgi:hypothetical protein
VTRTVRASLAAAALGAALLAPPSPAAAQGAAAAASDSLRVCVLVGDSLRELPATIDPATGDTLAGGKRYPAAFRKGRGYAESESWYVDNSAQTIHGHWTVKFGVIRVVLPPALLAPVGRYRGVPLFVAAGAAAPVPPVYYVPVRPGCVFQPYAVPVY